MLLSLNSADTIVFKDGMIVNDNGRTWRNDGQVKWATSGITIGYPEEDVERVEKTPIKGDVERVEKTPIKENPILTISKTQFSGNIKSRIFHRPGGRCYNCKNCAKNLIAGKKLFKQDIDLARYVNLSQI